MGLVPLKNDKDPSLPPSSLSPMSLSLCTYRTKARESTGASGCLQARRELPPEPDHAGILLLDFQHSEL